MLFITWVMKAFAVLRAALLMGKKYFCSTESDLSFQEQKTVLC